MKTLLAGLLAAAAVAPASAAVVNYSWSGGGYTVTGTITTSIESGIATENQVTAATMTVTGPSLNYSGAADVTSASWNLSTGALTGGIDFTVGSAGNAGLTGQAGLAWTLYDLSTFDTVADGIMSDVTISPVPEPEMMAAVAGAGLFAFGLFRRRASKA